MCVQCGLLCKNGRLTAGYTQQQASELLNISVESIGAYERGETEIPMLKYIDMSKEYGMFSMLQQYCALVCPIGDLLGTKPVINDDVDRVAIEFICTLRGAEPTKNKLLDIAADGVISISELPVLAEVIKELEKYVTTYNKLIAVYNQKHTS